MGPRVGTPNASTVCMRSIRRLLLAVVLCAPAMASTQCYVDADTPIIAEGYEPQYYDGSIVYYDGLGHPFYYNDGVQVWIPASSPYYLALVNHWRVYGAAYNRWYAGYGYRYRAWRGARGYYGGHAGYRGYHRR